MNINNPDFMYEKYKNGPSTWLVQRLEKPHPTGIPNPFSFGGGRTNGGLSNDFMEKIKHIFAFDYMGSAEYEFGAVPEAFKKIAGAKKLITFSFEVKGTSYKYPDYSKTGNEVKATIYVNTPDQFEDRGTYNEQKKRYIKTMVDAKEYVKDFILNDLHTKYGNRNLKQPTLMNRSIFEEGDNSRSVCGWLELNNGFMYFTDKQMYESTCTLFGLNPT